MDASSLSSVTDSAYRTHCTIVTLHHTIVIFLVLHYFHERMEMLLRGLIALSILNNS